MVQLVCCLSRCLCTHQRVVESDEISPELSWLNGEEPQLSQPLHVPPTLTVLVALHQTQFITSVSFVCGNAQKGTQYSRCDFTSAKRKGRITAFHPLPVLYRDAVDLFCCEGRVLTRAQWAKTTNTAIKIFSESEAQKMEVSSDLPSLWPFSCLLRITPNVSFRAPERGNCWLRVRLPVKLTCSALALIFSSFDSGYQCQANVYCQQIRMCIPLFSPCLRSTGVSLVLFPTDTHFHDKSFFFAFFLFGLDEKWVV